MEIMYTASILQQHAAAKGRNIIVSNILYQGTKIMPTKNLDARTRAHAQGSVLCVAFSDFITQNNCQNGF